MIYIMLLLRIFQVMDTKDKFKAYINNATPFA